MNSTRSPRTVLALATLLTSAALLPKDAQARALPEPPAALAMLPSAALFVAPTDDLLEQYGGVQKVFIDMMTELAKQLPSGTKNPRENMYAGLAAIWMAGAVGGAFNVGAGTALGAAIGTAADGVGAPIGAAVGFFGGLALTQAELVMLGVGTMGAVQYIEKTYPVEKYGALDGRAPTAMLGASVSSTHAGAWDGAFLVQTAGHAGPYESLFIHLVTASFNPSTKRLMQDLAKGGGTLGFLQPAAKQLLYIADNQRIAAGTKTAEPLDGWMKTASLLVRADQQTVEDLWLRALGIGSMSVSVKDGKLVITPPKLLRDLGAPEKVSQSLPALSLRINAPGPITASLRASLTPGPFSITLGDPKLVKSGADKGKVKIALKVAKGAVLASGSLEARINDDVFKLGGDFSPKLDREFVATAYFRFDGALMVFDHVDLGDLSIKAPTPELPAPVAAVVGGLVAQVEGEVEKVVAGMFRGSAIGDAFDAATKKSLRSLAKEVESAAKAKGLDVVSDVGKIEVDDGKMAVTVRGERLSPPTTPSTADVTAAFSSVTKAVKSKSPLGGVTFK